MNWQKLAVTLLMSCLAMPLLAKEYWLDVRMPQQYQQQHINGAVNLPLSELSSKISDIVEGKDDTIYLYCNSGRQSQLAKEALTAMGYLNVIDAGGIKTALENHPELTAVTN